MKLRDELDLAELGLAFLICFIILVFYILSATPATAKVWSTTMCGGFTEGKLDEPLMDDFWSGHNERTVPALFKTCKEAITRYEDVRRVKIIEQRRKRR